MSAARLVGGRGGMASEGGSERRAGSGECEVFGAAAEWVGRCASCRFSLGANLVGASGLVCAKWDGAEVYSSVKPQWRCDEYQYEPGAAA